MRTRARLLRAVGGGGESPVSGRAGSCREAGILARANRGRTANKRRSSRPKPGNRARARGVTARRTALAYGTQSKVTHNRLRDASAHRRTCACLGIGYRARRESTHSAGQPRTYRPGSAQHAAYRPIRRSGTEDRAWARLRFRAPRPPLCGRAPPTHLAPAVDLHWPWWLAHIADRISGIAQVSPVTEGAPHAVAHRHIHIADGSPVTPRGKLGMDIGLPRPRSRVNK